MTEARITQLRSAMSEFGVDLVALAPSDNLRYELGFSPIGDGHFRGTGHVDAALVGMGELRCNQDDFRVGRDCSGPLHIQIRFHSPA